MISQTGNNNAEKGSYQSCWWFSVDANKREAVKYSGIIDCARKIHANEGFMAFYKGLTPSMLKVFPSSGLFFLTYEGTLIFLSGGNTKNDWLKNCNLTYFLI